MSERPILRFANRGWRDLPTPTTRVRGAGELPYNPGRPLTLPGDRRKRRPPQFRTDALLRLLIPLGLLGGLGVGVFFGVEALLEEDEAPPEQVAAGPETAGGDAAVASVEGGTEAPEAEVGPIDGAAAPEAEPAAEPGTEVEAAEATGAAAGGVVTAAALGGAPILVERGGATPIPPGSRT